MTCFINQSKMIFGNGYFSDLYQRGMIFEYFQIMQIKNRKQITNVTIFWKN
jgi:hypothetical protein